MLSPNEQLTGYVAQGAKPSTYTDSRGSARFGASHTYRAVIHYDRVRRRPCPHLRPTHGRVAHGLPRTYVCPTPLVRPAIGILLTGPADPVTAVVPSQDNQTYLATTIDGHVRLMDMSTGKMLNDFTGHASSSYRIRACFGHGEASVVCGDEDGKVWAWDLVDVRTLLLLFL